MLITTALRRAFRTAFGPMPDAVPDDAATGLVLVADGIGGLDLCATALHYEVARAGLGHRVETIGWCHGFGHWYRDLTRLDNLRDHAARVAGRIRAFRAASPVNRPVFLVGKSGGCGVMLAALAQLPEDSVEAAVLIAPAVSRRYDLTRPLRAVHREMVVYWSPFDFVLLGAGTALLGTVDRVRTLGAGMTGFRTPRTFGDDGRALYETRLRQVRWGWRMARTGYLGGHVGPDSPWFLRRFVVPLFRVDASQAGDVSRR